MTLEEIYQQKCSEVCDINEHLETLRQYAARCRHITEFGVRGIVSTWALLAGLPKLSILVSYDLTNPGPESILGVTKLAAGNGITFRFVIGDTRKITIDETDLLFIDTFHVYQQLRKELELHGNKARKFIIMHDTEKFGIKGEAGTEAGLLPAISEFLAYYPHWKMRAQFFYNNGLTVLERK